MGEIRYVEVYRLGLSKEVGRNTFRALMALAWMVRSDRFLWARNGAHDADRENANQRQNRE